MKQCPNCSQVFGDETIFCLHDGTVLQKYGPGGYSINSSSEPTVLIPAHQIGPNASVPNSNRWLYPVLGILVIAVVVLGIYAFSQRSGSDKENSPEKLVTATNKPTVVQSPQNSQTQDSNVSQSEIPTKQIDSPTITREAARSLLDSWEKAQDAQNFGAYQSCYGQPFQGIKRARGSTRTYNYTSWLNDRRKMLAIAIGLDVELTNLQISVEGDTATANFDQYYRSVKFSDWGPKIIKIKMFPNGAKIVYEELKASYKLN